MTQVTRQQGEFWIDEAGNKIPANRVTNAEKKRESGAYKLAVKASKLSKELSTFKAYFIEITTEVVAAVLAELKRDPNKKGNYTWYNFDQTIKVECDVNERISFDPILIEAAKEKLLEVISTNIQGDDFIKEIVIDAFQTTSGKLDTRRVMGLRKHTTKIKTKAIRAEWEAAMELIDRSISRPDSKTYYRISVKNDQGEYEAISLDFSNVKSAIV
jgi:hypothetical protein